jgi:UDP-N-acetylmuramate: L-alanyl-gamma-D-glutamyl-meso-diaminopimelate ligase
VILEGDEYDTAFFDKRSKFLHYLPTTLIINNIEFDHADIFSSVEEIELAFKRCTLQVPGNGVIIANGDDHRVRGVIAHPVAPVITVGLGKGNTIQATDIAYGESTTTFTVIREGKTLGTIELALLGEFNVRNALAVLAAGLHHDLAFSSIAEAMMSFRNVKRRLELKGNYNGVTVYDDFAHHPTAIKGTLHALRTKYPDRRILAIFEPRSNTTRRNIFQKELAECFADADVVFMSQIARLHLLSEDERLNPEQVMADIRSKGKEAFYLQDAEAISTKAAELAKPNDVVIVMSNGGFGGIHGLLKNKIIGS